MTTTATASARRSIATTPRPRIKAQPLTCSIGAELFDVNLGEVSRDDVLFAELKSLLLQYKVVFLRDQDMTRAEHVALAERFGPLEDHPVMASDPEYPALVRIYKDLDSPAEHYENAYHCDATWRESPPMGAVLRCVEGPEVGGDTIWVNMALAYERLPEAVKSQIHGLRARHSIEATFGGRLAIDDRHRLKERFPDPEHPVVRTHPETGEKILFVNAFTTHLVNYHKPANIRCGIDYAPGAANLLSYLISQATIPEYQVRWRWTKNSVAIWDNRSTQHYAVQDYWPAVRKMERASIIGDRPF
ncbi:TauD/TfdA dioxygenase family protein [Mycobacterium sp. SMC-11]|uniref:TauD/TfdA dioxygenase family protein n=1 Tax=Mycobacterium sp. SMC-11 TaxID=3385969 RepID=UPI00390C458C